MVWGTGGHNCGGARCAVRAHVKNGRIVRITSDESPFYTSNTGALSLVDKDNRNCSLSRACTKCRAYKFRIYHPGRLRYPLKQTKKRGDLTGFVRTTWEEALNEISRKHKAIVEKYGPEAVFLNYACGAYQSSYQGGGYTGLWAGSGTGSWAGNALGGYTAYWSHYSWHQNSYMGSGFTGHSATGGGAADVAGVVKNAVLWGTNRLSTQNNVAFPTLMAYKQMRARGGKVWFVCPEFTDSGVLMANEWVQLKPYTDQALMLAMMNHLITNTFDEDGNKRADIVAEKQLDVDWLDSMVFGFFDSPAYDLNTTSYVVTAAGTGGSGTKTVPEVPAGRSLSAYIMGSDKRLTKARYDVGDNYNAQQFSALGYTFRNMSECSYSVTAGANTKYLRKKDYMTPKTPEWAEKITGVPAAKIRELAELYADPANHPIYQEWSGGQQKQADGCYNLMILQAFALVTKTWGLTGEAIPYGGLGGSRTSGQAMPVGFADISRPSKTHPETPIPSCTAWHNGIKFALGDQLKEKGYQAKYVPDWLVENNNAGIANIGTGKAYHDDGGTKALLSWQREDGKKVDTHYQWIKKVGDSYECYGAPDKSYADVAALEAGLVADYGMSAANAAAWVADVTTANRYSYKTWRKDNATGNPIFSGLRFIMNPGGNILMNQHMNPNDSRDMFEKLEVASKNPDDPDTLCIVAVDNFLSPTPRWSDYIFPAATQWEQDDSTSMSMGGRLIEFVVSNPPGQSKSMYNFTNEFLKAYEKVDTSKAGISTEFTGGVPDKQYVDYVKENWMVQANTPSSIYYKKDWKFFMENNWLGASPAAAESTTSESDIKKAANRRTFDEYIANNTPAVRRTTPCKIAAINTNTTPRYGNQVAYPMEEAPQHSNRFHVYSHGLVYGYKARFSAWHGYLPVEKRGQTNMDREGDDIVLPIPMYFPAEDYAYEAYGSVPEDPIGVTTTHDRHRAHSSMSENPLLRELTHRVRGGKIYSGNDWNEYALAGSDNGVNNATGAFPRVNKAIQDKSPNATWSEIWLSDVEAERRGIKDGDLVQLENAVGSVRCIAKVTSRAVKGFAGLHQGCWYDPDPIDGVDDGGCANTLMASKPSRIDHGNGQQTALVSIKKI